MDRTAIRGRARDAAEPAEPGRKPTGGSPRNPRQRPQNGNQGTGAAEWRTIEVRHLAALAAVAHEGSFRGAADRLGYVQSAISNHISHLERSAGARLVERARGSAVVYLTPAGEVLLGHTREIMARLDAAYADVMSLSSQAPGMVRVAGLEQFGPNHFARILRYFRERYPLAAVSLEEAGCDEVNLERLTGHTLDLVVAAPPPVDERFACLPVECDPFVLLVRTDSPLAQRCNPPTAAEIAALPLVVPSRVGFSDLHRAQLRQRGIALESCVDVESVTTAQALVAAGMGAAIVPRSHFDRSIQGTVAIAVPGVLPERTIALVHDAERDCPTAVHGFIRAIAVACKVERLTAEARAA